MVCADLHGKISRHIRPSTASAAPCWQEGARAVGRASPGIAGTGRSPRTTLALAPFAGARSGRTTCHGTRWHPVRRGAPVRARPARATPRRLGRRASAAAVPGTDASAFFFARERAFDAAWVHRDAQSLLHQSCQRTRLDRLALAVMLVDQAHYLGSELVRRPGSARPR